MSPQATHTKPTPAEAGQAPAAQASAPQASAAPASAAPASAAEADASQSGADILLRALKDQGVEVDFGYPGRRRAADLRRAVQAEPPPPHPGAPRAGGAVHAAEGYARSTGKVGVVLVTCGPGATNAVTGLTRRADGLHPDGLPDRPGADAPDRQRRLPGGGHHRHHPAMHQAQLPGQGRRTISRAWCTRRSTSRAPAGPARW